MSHTLLSVQNLSAWYDRKPSSPAFPNTSIKERMVPVTLRGMCKKMVLSDISFALGEHEIVGLIGLNGAGKTTLLKVLSGLLPSFRTENLLFDNRPVTLRGRNFKRCRYTVFAEDNSFPYFTFREYLSYVSAAYQKNLPDISELICGFHFEDYTDCLLKDLSTGNRKKAFLITGFALKLPLLFLDEPVNGLDFQSTEYLYQQISGYKQYGTILFSSHILESITLTSDRVLVLENGKIERTFAGEQINASEIRKALHDEHDL